MFDVFVYIYLLWLFVIYMFINIYLCIKCLLLSMIGFKYNKALHFLWYSFNSIERKYKMYSRYIYFIHIIQHYNNTLDLNNTYNT